MSSSPDIKLVKLSCKSALLTLYYRRLIDRIAAIPGDVVECGVFQGKSLAILGLCLRDAGQSRRLWGFDSFCGFPDPSPHDTGPKAVRGHCASTESTARETLEFFLGRGALDRDIKLVAGFFDVTLPAKPPSQIALLHLDVDLYESYRCCLHHLYPKLAPGGVIAFDEYDAGRDSVKWPGAKRAIDEFTAETGLKLERDPLTDKVFCVRA